MVLDEYLFMLLKSSEKDRFFWFQTDASVRDGMSWNDFCSAWIELPPIDVQKRYVDIYLAMLANQRAYEQGLDDLKLVCDAYIEDLRRKMPSEEIGKYLTRCDFRNNQNICKNVKGISTSKVFRDPTSKVWFCVLSERKSSECRLLRFYRHAC